MTNERKIKFYTTLLTYYLLFYGALHLLAMIFFFGFERGWGGFAYFLLFCLHLPFILLGGLLTFLGTKTQNRIVWFLTFICFILSNGWWVYNIFYNSVTISQVLLLGLTTLILIVASAQLIRLTK